MLNSSQQQPQLPQNQPVSFALPQLSIPVLNGAHLNSQEQIKKEKKMHRGKSVSNFIQKTYNILQEKRFQSIIGWTDSYAVIHSAGNLNLKRQNSKIKIPNSSSSSFVIHNIKAFEQIVLPAYFKHSNLSSFVRQLNMYNFHKVRGDKNQYEFEHDKFRKERPDLLREIKRKQSQSNISIPSQMIIQGKDEEFEVKKEERQPNLQEIDQIKNQDFKDQSEEAENQKNIESSNSEKVLKEEEVDIIKYQKSHETQKLEKIAKRLEDLQQVNKSLKKIKQSKLSTLKSINQSNNKKLVLNKFGKVIISLISSKIKAENYKKLLDLGKQKLSMNELIDHIINEDQCRQFTDYLPSTDFLFLDQMLQAQSAFRAKKEELSQQH